MRPGPRNLITDVPGLRVGNAQDEQLKSGVTVLTADTPFVASCAVMGGAPGTRETDLLEPDRLVQAVDALVLSGGSAFGLDEFYAHAQGPSVRSFPGRRGSWPKEAFIAEGPVAGFAGWPSFIGNFTGAPFRGIAPTGGPISKNVMDFYTARGSRLSENWVLIDLIRFAADCGVDLLADMPEDPETFAA